MKNNIVIDFDSTRNPSIFIGKLVSTPVNTEQMAPKIADLETMLHAIITQMRVLEQNGFQIAPLLKGVIKMIEEGTFDANLIINVNAICKEK